MASGDLNGSGVRDNAVRGIAGSVQRSSWHDTQQVRALCSDPVRQALRQSSDDLS